MGCVRTDRRSTGGGLAGDYVGASGNIGVGVGVGANVLFGGSDRTIALQPLLVEGQVGINLAWAFRPCASPSAIVRDPKSPLSPGDHRVGSEAEAQTAETPRSAPRYGFPGSSPGGYDDVGIGVLGVRLRPRERARYSMADFKRSYPTTPPGVATDRALIDAGLRAHMIRVYNYMAIGVALTGLVAWLTSQILGPALLNSPLMWVFVLAPLALVFFISFRINSLSAGTALTLFFVYAASVGLSLATIFFVYTENSITRVFFISAAAFGALSVWGYTTRRRCTGLGSFLLMGLIGIVIASLVNIFLKSSGLDSIISVIGVLVFAGLTAWDTQKIKEMYDPMDDGTVVGRKAVMGALALYLDFINLFMMLLRLFGSRR